MGFFRALGRGLKKTGEVFFNVGAWMDFRQIKASARQIATSSKQLFTPAASRPERHESFESAIERLQLTDEILDQRTKEFKRLTLIFSIGTALLWLYLIWLITQGSVKGAWATFGVSLVIAAQAFRYHFWWFQMRQRKLGCTLREWFWVGIVGKKL